MPLNFRCVSLSIAIMSLLSISGIYSASAITQTPANTPADQERIRVVALNSSNPCCSLLSTFDEKNKVVYDFGYFGNNTPLLRIRDGKVIGNVTGRAFLGENGALAANASGGQVFFSSLEGCGNYGCGSEFVEFDHSSEVTNTTGGLNCNSVETGGLAYDSSSRLLYIGMGADTGIGYNWANGMCVLESAWNYSRSVYIPIGPQPHCHGYVCKGENWPFPQIIASDPTADQTFAVGNTGWGSTASSEIYEFSGLTFFNDRRFTLPGWTSYILPLGRYLYVEQSTSNGIYLLTINIATHHIVGSTLLNGSAPLVYDSRDRAVFLFEPSHILKVRGTQVVECYNQVGNFRGIYSAVFDSSDNEFVEFTN